VVVWTVNKPEDIVRLIDGGVDGIISDRPDVLTRIARRKGVVEAGRLRPQSPPLK
jgi:glycerophosphoryl diester phosphodiesterase